MITPLNHPTKAAHGADTRELAQYCGFVVQR